MDEARELLDMPAARTGGDVYKTTFSDIFVRADEDPVAVSSSMANLQYGEEAPAEETADSTAEGAADEAAPPADAAAQPADDAQAPTTETDPAPAAQDTAGTGAAN